MAKQARETTLYGMQRLLAEAVWDEDGVRDEGRRLAVETLGREHAILALDETSFFKRGEHSAGVAHQYCGTTGRVEDCQVGVFLDDKWQLFSIPLISYYVALTLASSTVFQDHEGQFHIISWITQHGHTLIDRELYLPACWTEDRLRCQQAGIPPSVPFRTKPELALLMLTRLREAHLLADWVVADTVYGGNAALREWLEAQGQAYVGMVPCTEPIVLTLPDGTLRRIEVGDLPALLPQPLAWIRLTTSTGPKGPLTFDWLCFPLWHRGREDGQHFVLLRRFLEEPNQITFALVFAPEPTPLPRLVTVVGSRWHIEEDFANGKHLGMDHYEVRSYRGWYRYYSECSCVTVRIMYVI